MAGRKNNFQKISYLLSVFVLIVFCFFIKGNSAEAACNVIDADFRSSVPYPTNYFTAPGNEPFVYLDIDTQDCVGESITLSVSAVTSFFMIEEYLDLDNFDNIQIDVTEPNFTIQAKATAEKCSAVGGGWDCIYIIRTWDEGGEEIWENSEEESLQYDCYGTFTCEGDTNLFEAPWIRIPDTFPPDSVSEDDQYSDQNIPPFISGGYGPLDESYLAPLPGLSNATPPENRLKGFLQGLFQVLIIIAGILAVIMIVIGAITYLSTDAFSGKSEGKEMMLNAVFGLILALGGWIIINTINPKLASELSITIPKVQVDNYNYSSPGIVSSTGGSACKDPTLQVNNCPTCQAIPAPVEVDVSNNQVIPLLAGKLVALETSSGAMSWAVTEAFPPSVQHCSPCHYTGTCVDANFRNQTQPTNENIRTFIDLAKSKGLKAVYETNSSARFNELIAAGFKRKQEVILWAAITAPHFSVYNH